jgi:tetratricopeptide (TPR) repeat protein
MAASARFAVVTACALLLSAPVMAIGEDGEDPEPASAAACPSGDITAAAIQGCLDASPGSIADNALASYAYGLAQDGSYQDSLAVLDMMQNPNTAVALNYRGYATRMLGDVEQGIAYYMQSIALDPSYPEVRAYLGHAYLTQGRADLATQQLAAIEQICGTTCEPYQDLAEAIQQASI